MKAYKNTSIRAAKIESEIRLRSAGRHQRHTPGTPSYGGRGMSRNRPRFQDVTTCLEYLAKQQHVDVMDGKKIAVKSAGIKLWGAVEFLTNYHNYVIVSK